MITWWNRNFYLNAHLPSYSKKVVLKPDVRCYSQAFNIPELLPHCVSLLPAELSLVFVDKPEKANLLLEGVENKLIPGLKTIVLMDSYGSDLLERGKKCGVEIISMKAMEVSHPALPPSLNSSSEVILAQMWCLSSVITKSQLLLVL